MPVPEIIREDYGVKANPDGVPGYIKVTATKQQLGPGARLDRVREYDEFGMMYHSYLRDKLGMRFKDNLPNTEDDSEYVTSLPSRDQS